MSLARWMTAVVLGCALATPAMARGVAGDGDALLGIDADVELTLPDLGLMRGWEQQSFLAEVVKEQPWTADGTEGVLRLKDGTQLEVEVFGSWVSKSNTFSWAWATAPNDIPASAYRMSSKARFLGGAEGFEQLVTAHQKMTRDEALAMAIMAAGSIDGIHAIFLAPSDFGAVLLAVTDFKIDLPVPSLAKAADVVYRGVSSNMLVHQRDAVRGYLEGRGFTVEGDAMQWRAQHPEAGQLLIKYSPAGRVVSVGCLGVGSMACQVSDASLAAIDRQATRAEAEREAALASGGAVGDAKAVEATKKASDEEEADKDRSGRGFGRLKSSAKPETGPATCLSGTCPTETGSWWLGFWFSS